MGRGIEHPPEQVVHLLRKIDAAVIGRKSLEQACREEGIPEPTYHRWRIQYGGLGADQAKKLKELMQENAKLRRLVAQLSLDKQRLKEILSDHLRFRISA